MVAHRFGVLGAARAGGPDLSHPVQVEDPRALLIKRLEHLRRADRPRGEAGLEHGLGLRPEEAREQARRAMEHLPPVASDRVNQRPQRGALLDHHREAAAGHRPE